MSMKETLPEALFDSNNTDDHSVCTAFVLFFATTCNFSVLVELLPLFLNYFSLLNEFILST